MKVVSIINLKGGVGKTISAINIAHVLAEVHGKRVLLVDNDKQGSVSRFFEVHSYEKPSIADVLTVKDFPLLLEAVTETGYAHGRLDVLPANMMLLRADKEILLDCARPQQTRLAKALRAVEDAYDFVIIDNAPDLNMSVINALVASHDVMIPIKIDNFAFDGVKQILEQVEEIKEGFNPDICVAGGFVTMWQKNNVNAQGEEWLQEHALLPMLRTAIRKTVAVDETTFNRMPLLAYKPNSTAARDYEALVAEYLKL